MKIKKKRFLIIGFTVILVASLFFVINDKQSAKQGKTANNHKVMEAASVYSLVDNDWSVNYRVKNKGVYFENIIPRFSFQGSVSNLPNHLDGYIAVFIDGKWNMNVYQSIFILKNINQGKHEITLKLKKKDGTDYGLKKNIFVHVR